MDRKLDSNFVMPSVSVPVFSAINALILVAINEKLIVPFLRSKTTISDLTKSKKAILFAVKPHLTSATTSLLPPNHRSLNFSSSTTPLCIKNLRLTCHNPIKYSTTPKITATISVGDKLPDATLSYLGTNGRIRSNLKETKSKTLNYAM